MHKEHQTPSPEQLDKKALAVLKAQRGLTLSTLLTVVRGATGKTLSESLKRLQATHRVTKAKHRFRKFTGVLLVSVRNSSSPPASGLSRNTTASCWRI